MFFNVAGRAARQNVLAPRMEIKFGCIRLSWRHFGSTRSGPQTCDKHVGVDVGIDNGYIGAATSQKRQEKIPNCGADQRVRVVGPGSPPISGPHMYQDPGLVP